MTRFLLVRHGQTQWNREERFRGRADLPLNETGARQAEAVAWSLKAWPVSAIYHSPLKRALETASIIAGALALPSVNLDALIDIDFGSWTGLSDQEAATQDGALWHTWLESPQKVRFPGGESLDDVRQRVVAAVEELAVRHDRQTVILVSHNVVCRVLMCAMLGLDNSRFWQVKQDVCTLNIFELRDSLPTVSLLNDTCHLKTLATG